MKRVLVYSGLLGILSLSQSSAHTEQPTLQVPGTYSNLEFNEEGGDLLGMEVKIVPVGDHFQAAVLISEGEPESMTLVNVIVRGDSVTFNVPGKDGWKFSGRMTSKSLDGTVTYASGGVEKVVLLRRCGYWDR